MRWLSSTPTHGNRTNWTVTGHTWWYVSLIGLPSEWVSLTNRPANCLLQAVLSLRAFQSGLRHQQQPAVLCTTYFVKGERHTHQVWRSGGSTPLTLNLATTCGELHVPAVYPRVERSQETGWDPSWHWTEDGVGPSSHRTGNGVGPSSHRTGDWVGPSWHWTEDGVGPS